MVPSNSVKVQSATPASVNYDKNKHSTYLPSPSPYLPSSSSQPFSPELPSFIMPTSSAPASPPTTQKVDYLTENSLTKITNNLLNNDNLSPPFTHSAITHGEVDAVVLDDDLPTADQFYGASSVADYGQSSQTPKPSKVTYIKPAFKPKPTKGSSEPTTDKYVLVHTISNDKPPTPTNSQDSIDSIILMLNETKSGSQYSTQAVTETVEHRETTTTTAQTKFPTTSSINYDKYGPTSFYITTKLPAPTKIPSKTSKPTASSPALSYTVSSSLDFQNTVSSVSRLPNSTTTHKPLVTSYISSTVIPKRPTTSATKKGVTKKPTKRPSPTTVKVTAASLVTKKQPTKTPLLIASSTQSVSPTYTYSSPSVFLNQPTKESLRPQQPIFSIVHEDTVQISGGAITDRPHPTVHITPKPVNVSTASYAPPPTRIGAPTNTPFVTKRPANVIFTTAPYIFETPPVAVSSQAPGYNSYYTPTTIVSTTSIYSHEQLDHHYYDQDVQNGKPTATEAEPAGNSDDLISFPPVRHPNLNMSAEVLDQKPLNTPVFIEDEKLNNKMNLLVSKIVASLQSNFENLEDLVNESNVTTRPVTRRPPQPATAVTRRPTTTTTTARPRTTTRPRVTTTKRPLRITTTTTTRRPTTRRPVTSPVPVTRRPTTRRPKPTRKATTTTSTSTEASVQEDEYVEEVSEQDYEEDVSGGVDQGRIRKLYIFMKSRIVFIIITFISVCGTRPQVKSGRIVGGKSSAFGEYPWQVLVRESTWLGLFTKNKCGGVLISKNYVVTAAHCQPG